MLNQKVVDKEVLFLCDARSQFFFSIEFLLAFPEALIFGGYASQLTFADESFGPMLDIDHVRLGDETLEVVFHFICLVHVDWLEAELCRLLDQLPTVAILVNHKAP